MLWLRRNPAHPVLRPALQARDVVLAVRPIIFASNASQLVPTLLSQLWLWLKFAELSERLQWMWLLCRDLTISMRDRILWGHVFGSPPNRSWGSCFSSCRCLWQISTKAALPVSRPGSGLRFWNSTHLKLFQLTFQLSWNLFFNSLQNFVTHFSTSA